MGFFSRLLIPRGVRRAMHPGRAVKRAITPKPIKRARRALSPVDNMKYSLEPSLATSLRSGGRGKTRRKSGARSSIAPVYRHGTCPVNHRTPEAAARCRNA